MGAWGHGSFENDSALDWLSDVIDGNVGLVEETLHSEASSGGEYLELDECSAALAAAELVAAALGKGTDRLNEDASTWLDEHREIAREIGAEIASRAVERVFRESELRELWDENGSDTNWHAEVRELLRRLAN